MLPGIVFFVSLRLTCIMKNKRIGVDGGKNRYGGVMSAVNYDGYIVR